MDKYVISFEMGVWVSVVALLLICGVGPCLILKDIGFWKRVRKSCKSFLCYILKNMQAKQRLRKQLRNEFQLHFHTQKMINRRKLYRKLSNVWSKERQDVIVRKTGKTNFAGVRRFE